MKTIRVRQIDPAHRDVHPLLQAHLTMASQTSSPDACHALDLAALQSQDIAFYAAYLGATAVGCAALKTLTPQQAEIKSVHVAASARGQGIAKQLMQALHEIARNTGKTELLLETGSQALPAFDAARALYKSLGYQERLPFGEYLAHPHSTFMELSLT